MLTGTLVSRQDSQCAIRLSGGQVVHATATGTIAPGDSVVAAIRPEHVEVGIRSPACANTLATRIDDLVYHGDHSRVRAGLEGGGSLLLRAPSQPGQIGSTSCRERVCQYV